MRISGRHISFEEGDLWNSLTHMKEILLNTSTHISETVSQVLNLGFQDSDDIIETGLNGWFGI